MMYLKVRTQQDIFNDMHRELRAWNPQIPQSPDRLDPILKIVLELYAHELARIDQRVGSLWEGATNSLIRALNPECTRWPVPAYTVIKCEVSDPVVQIDRHTRFYYREKREGGQTFFFSALKNESLVQATVPHAFLTIGDIAFDLKGMALQSDDTALPDLPFSASDSGTIYLAVDFGEEPSRLAGTLLFLDGHSSLLRQLRWANWFPSSASGEFYTDSGFCPGTECCIDDIVDGATDSGDFGGLRSCADLFRSLEDNFVVLPDVFTRTWEVGETSTELGAMLNTANIAGPGDTDRFLWIKVKLPPGGDKRRLASALDARFGCFVATNRNELTLFKHTGGNRIVELEIPEPIDSVLELGSVVDSSARNYLPRHKLPDDSTAGAYALEERDNRLVLWFDYSSETSPPPDSITVTYSVTAGISANGIEIGRINELYENHPGIAEGENVMPVTGAIPAKTEKQIVDEVSARLRGRDRALTFSEMRHWATSFDPRITGARCANGTELGNAGVRRCIVVTLALRLDEFCSDDEINLLCERLRSFLKSRAPINTHFKVEVART